MTLEVIKELPCGEKLAVVRFESRNEYFIIDKHGVEHFLWSPRETHRVALLSAILAEDEFKYNKLAPTATQGGV